MSWHASRQKLALEFGATDIVTVRGDEGVARIKELTEGLGVHSVVEAHGTPESMMQATARTKVLYSFGRRSRSTSSLCVFGKLGVRSRLELTTRTIAHGD